MMAEFASRQGVLLPVLSYFAAHQTNDGEGGFLHVFKTDWHGSLRRLSLPGGQTARTGPRSAADAGPVREALRKDQQERLRRCRSHCRSGGTSADALRADQERRSAGYAVAASGAGSLGRAQDIGDQSDSRTAARAWHYVSEGTPPCGSFLARRPRRSGERFVRTVAHAVGTTPG